MKTPTIEEIYNCYHRETMFSIKGFYPKSIKNFDKVLNDSNIELLKKFQNFINRNGVLIDWKIYIKALSKYYQRRFDLKLLTSIGAIKIYRQYVEFYNGSENLADEEIKQNIIKSLTFLINYLKENEISLKDYFNLNTHLVPESIKHLYSGSVSKYFYACISFEKLIKIFFNVTNDIFEEFFQMSKTDYLESIRMLRLNIIRRNQILDIIKKIEEKINI